jgi:hypothetical protein
VPFVLQLVLGVFAFFALLALGVTLSVTTNHPAGFVVVTLLGGPALTVLAWKKWHWRGFPAGMLIALALCLLLAGLCAAFVALAYR